MGVHQIFQLSLAAEECGELEALHCSLVDLPGKWGRCVARNSQGPSLRPLGYESLQPNRVVEHPLPFITHKIGSMLLPFRRTEHLHTATWFSKQVAQWLNKGIGSPRLFVGSEIAALEAIRAAKSRGMTSILDCPGIPNEFLDFHAKQAAAEIGLPQPKPSNSQKLIERKKAELDLCDLVLCCSDFQAEQLAAQGIPSERLRVVPLWADHFFWSAISPVPKVPESPLRVLFVGTLSLKKGLPYLLAALSELGTAVECLLVGRPSSEMLPALARLPANCRLAGHASKEQLRAFYAAHDVLVMPTLGDSFGFVGMEAMSTGLPVIASAHAGLPLPNPDWRVPVRNAEAIATRLLHYARQPDALTADCATARNFAAQFTPERYRQHIRQIYLECLP